MEPRWEGDERREGVADGRRLTGDVDQFRGLLTAANWVAEDPQKHLLPHLQQACASPDANFAAVFALVGQIAETGTYVRQGPGRNTSPNSPAAIVFEVATGIPSGDGPFATHGHLVGFHVQPATGP